MNPRFTINLTYCHWSCGDGCCSDSGYKFQLLDNEEVILNEDDWKYHSLDSRALDRCIDEITEILGRVPVKCDDYTIVEDSEEV